MFDSEGIPCRHILFVLKGRGFSEIPSHCIVNRWTKLATSRPVFDCDGNVLEACSKFESERTLVSKAWAQLFKCMHMAGTNKEKLLLIYNEGCSIEQKMSKMKSDVVSRPLDEVEALIGVNVPEKIEVLPPKPSHTKGSGKHIKGGKEKAMEHAQRSLRQCQTCKKYATHDSRNCPTKSSS
ncbi:unnamed protein product [Trifolium pratense]|uniref:Uncharacterized protein n=1 Tax=Trifolium pratense TaxID=57577 RepID=A0ACB0J1F4_TRIPR|nr:unnamed protein product [Trifolium pratense]